MGTLFVTETTMRRYYRTNILLLLAILWTPCAAMSATVVLPVTGQTSCWDANGTLLGTCANTGQDGDTFQGATWPATRFIDNSNGTITDSLTGLVWLKNANCFGTQTWSNSLTSANNLASGACGLSDGSTAGAWRLPNRKELFSLINRQQSSSSTWLTGLGFSSVLSKAYWTSSSYANNTNYAWSIRMYDGGVYSDSKSNSYYLLPVSGGLSSPLAPDTSITIYPPASTTLTVAEFGFTSPGSNVTFECQLDSDSWNVCTPVMTYSGLPSGSHTFYVRAVNQEGISDSTPASYSWTISTIIDAPCNAKIGSNCYETLAAAYTAAINGNTIKIRDITFTKSLNTKDLSPTKGITITLQGGYDSYFSEPPTGVTTIKGLSISSESVKTSGIRCR